MLRRQPGQRSFVAVGVVFLVCLLAGLAGTAARRIDGGIERLSIDARFSLRGRVAPDRRVVIVGLDNQSYLSLPRPPLPRALDADLVQQRIERRLCNSVHRHVRTSAAVAI
jgi:CHASE2 domain-containing sensor protein